MNIHAPLLDINVTITPVDNTHPYVILGGPLFVNEGDQAVINQEVLAAHDIDTPMYGLRFIITKQPKWGVLENIRQALTSNQEMNNFTLLDLTDDVILYKQTNNSHVEPLSDSFEIYVTDGVRSSHPSAVQISIIPQNDEIPSIRCNNITVAEGGSVLVDRININDIDLPSESLQLSIQQLPAHGTLSTLLGDTDEAIDAPLPAYVSVHDIGNSVHIVYNHDNTENFRDSFIIEVSDGTHTSTGTVYVEVIPTNDEQPMVTT